jgi:acylphosphatase
MIIQYHLHISGDVQGVGLRYRLAKKARETSILGWVKNLPGGRVEGVMQGEEKELKKIMVWLPKYTQINDLKTYEEPLEKFSDFEIRF